jgi:hypothetical protein
MTCYNRLGQRFVLAMLPAANRQYLGQPTLDIGLSLLLGRRQQFGCGRMRGGDVHMRPGPKLLALQTLALLPFSAAE